jgi:hypothetical protein
LRKPIYGIIILLVLLASAVYIRFNYTSQTIWLKTGDSIKNVNIQFIGRANKNLFVLGHNENNKIERFYVPIKKEFKVLTAQGTWHIQVLDNKEKPLQIKLRYRLQKQ